MVSDVGTGWPTLSLREVALKIQDGTHFSPKMGGNDYRYVTSKNIGAGYLKLQNVEMISAAEHRKIYGRCDVKYGDLLLTKDGANTGNAAISTFREEVSLLSSVAFIRCDPRKATEAYLLQFLLSEVGNRQIKDAMSGNAITRLTLGKINALTLPLPTVGEQREIASALTTVDALAYSLERLIAKKQAIKQGMMQQLITGNIRLPGYFGTWRSDPVGSVCVVDPESLSPATVEASAQIDYISLEDVSKGSVLGSTRYRFGDAPSRARRAITQDDVLFGTVRPNLQSHARYQGGFARPVASTGFAVIRSIPNLTDPSFLSHWVLSHAVSVQIGKIIAGSNYPAVSSKDVRQLNIELPPLEEQVGIGRTLDDADAEICALKSRLVVTQNIKQGMMQALLTGRTRLMSAEVAA